MTALKSAKEQPKLSEFLVQCDTYGITMLERLEPSLKLASPFELDKIWLGLVSAAMHCHQYTCKSALDCLLARHKQREPVTTKHTKSKVKGSTSADVLHLLLALYANFH